MYDGGKIILGLLIFLIIITLPIWYNFAVGKAGYKPEIEIATAGVEGKDQCVMPTDYMTSQHMDLLNEWRDEVIRENSRTFETGDGRYYEKSLTHTCMDCHSNKENFCDKCHDYLDVSPYCWDCHIIPKEVN